MRAKNGDKTNYWELIGINFAYKNQLDKYIASHSQSNQNLMKNKRKKTVTADLTNTNEVKNTDKKAKAKNYLPDSQLDMSELGKRLLQRWHLVFPNLNQLPAYSWQQLNDVVNSFANQIIQAQNLDNDKKANTNNLAKVNQIINVGVGKLRQYVRDEFAAPADQIIQFAFYGLEKSTNQSYLLPADNDSRQQALPRLIAHFANSPFVNRNFGLSQWQTLQTQHSNYWAESQRLRGARSVLAAHLVSQFALIKAIAKHIYQYIKLAFPAEQVAARRREIGF